MKKLIDLFTKIRQMSSRRLKIYTTSFVIVSLILLPDLYLEGAHHLLELLHVCYEGLCFMFEELIGHTLHLSKYHSQLILFYVQVFIVAGLIYKLWRAAPRLYRRTAAYFRASCLRLVKDGKELWAEMSGLKRMKVLAGCAAGIFGLYFWATS
jgi:hypothetical protein